MKKEEIILYCAYLVCFLQVIIFLGEIIGTNTKEPIGNEVGNVLLGMLYLMATMIYVEIRKKSKN